MTTNTENIVNIETTMYTPIAGWTSMYDYYAIRYFVSQDNNLSILYKQDFSDNILYYSVVEAGVGCIRRGKVEDVYCSHHSTFTEMVKLIDETHDNLNYQEFTELLSVGLINWDAKFVDIRKEYKDSDVYEMPVYPSGKIILQRKSGGLLSTLLQRKRGDPMVISMTKELLEC